MNTATALAAVLEAIKPYTHDDEAGRPWLTAAKRALAAETNSPAGIEPAPAAPTVTTPDQYERELDQELERGNGASFNFAQHLFNMGAAGTTHSHTIHGRTFEVSAKVVPLTPAPTVSPDPKPTLVGPMPVWSLTTQDDSGLWTGLYLNKYSAYEALACTLFSQYDSEDENDAEDIQNHAAMIAALTISTDACSKWLEDFQQKTRDHRISLILEHNHPWTVPAAIDANNPVVVTISGGVAQVADHPAAALVEVLDFDDISETLRYGLVSETITISPAAVAYLQKHDQDTLNAINIRNQPASK